MGKAITAKVSIDQHSTSSDSSHRDLPGVTPEEYHCPSTTGRRERGLARSRNTRGAYYLHTLRADITLLEPRFAHGVSHLHFSPKSIH